MMITIHSRPIGYDSIFASRPDNPDAQVELMWMDLISAWEKLVAQINSTGG